MDEWQRRGIPSGQELDDWLEADGHRMEAGMVPLNIGCRCGPGCLGDDGLIGADADGMRGIADITDHLGLAPGMLEAALAEYREIGIFRLNLDSAAYVTPSGGLRVLWRVSAGRALRTVGKDKGHQGLRLMWTGSQTVLPPSVGSDGAYRWLPDHSPWQVGFGLAPTSVLRVMGAHGETSKPSIVMAPLTAYSACAGDLGPDRDGRLVDASWLPYDQRLLRDGVPEGQRSEAVRRLELQMLVAGWTETEIVAVLSGQPWVNRMRSNIVGWLCSDIGRARSWLTQQTTAQAENSAEERSTESVAGGDASASSAGPGSRLARWWKIRRTSCGVAGMGWCSPRA
jgi:hypothetical protein